MKTISYLIVAIITVSISACSSDPGFNLDIEKNLDRSLVMSTYDLQTQTKSLLKKMDSLPDAQTTYWKNNWQPKAMQAEQISDSISNYIEALKSEVKVQAKVQMPNGAEVYDNIDRDGVRKIFDTEAKGYELYIALKKYNDDMQNIDSLITNNFQHTFIDVTKIEWTGDYETGQDFIQKNFTNTTVLETLTLLSYYKNQIAISENKVVSFCVSQAT